jgi:hypothetical protein
MSKCLCCYIGQCLSKLDKPGRQSQKLCTGGWIRRKERIIYDKNHVCLEIPVLDWGLLLSSRYMNGVRLRIQEPPMPPPSTIILFYLAIAFMCLASIIRLIRGSFWGKRRYKAFVMEIICRPSTRTCLKKCDVYSDRNYARQLFVFHIVSLQLKVCPFIGHLILFKTARITVY